MYTVTWLLLPLVVASLMVLAGIDKSALDWRRARVCPACGRLTPRCRCRR